MFAYRNQYVQAKLIKPPPKRLSKVYSSGGFHDPMQNEPYGVSIKLTFRINQKHPHPDNYIDDAGFQIYSERLVRIIRTFKVNAEYFPIGFVDESNKKVSNLRYFVFHILEGVLPAMDEKRSGWTGNREIGIKNLVLDYSVFEQRPMFICNNIYVPLMRNDLKTAIEEIGITGFIFSDPEKYHTGYRKPLLKFNTASQT